MADRPLTGVLLVGGASSRFGSPKALAQLGGETLAGRAWRVLGDVCDERIAVGKVADGLELPFPLVDDGSAVRAPIAGVVAGLRAASHELCVVVPVDCPLVSPASLRLLADSVGVPQTGPLPGAYPRSALPVLERRLAAGELALRDAVRELGLPIVEVDAGELVNVNAPADLELVRSGAVTAAVVPETELEARIVSDPDWIEGAAWGVPRPGHPEGSVGAHVVDVLAHVDEVARDDTDRRRLRLVALVHDALKYQVNRDRPRTGENHHARIARRFAERYIEDHELLEVIELHDEAHNAWAHGRRSGSWDRAEKRARRLVERLGSSVDFYVRFYRADNASGSKDRACLEWFEQLVERRPGATRASGQR